MSLRSLIGVVVTAAIVLAGCGDDDDPAPATTPASTNEVSISEARATTRGFVEEGFREPANVIGGDEPIGPLVERIDRDAALFFAEALEQNLGSPTISREPGPCDGKQVKANGYPRYCSAEKQIVAPLAGARAVRRKHGAAALYVLLGWAHTKAAAAALGWERYPKDQLDNGRLCLFGAWFRYLNYQVVLENSDYPVVDRTIKSHPAFADTPGALEAVSRGSDGADLCVG